MEVLSYLARAYFRAGKLQQAMLTLIKVTQLPISITLSDFIMIHAYHLTYQEINPFHTNHIVVLYIYVCMIHNITIYILWAYYSDGSESVSSCV